MPRGEHANSRAAHLPFQRKKGDPPLNKTGRNQWSALRERARERLATDLDVLLDVLLDRAHRGDVTALRLALGSILDIEAHQFVDDDGVPMTFANLARKARGSA
jgi:hypothetical protein